MRLEAPPPAWFTTFCVLFVAATTASASHGTNEDQLILKSSTTKSEGNACRQMQFQCNSSVCLDSSLLCNGREDCEDGSDETQEICASNICGDHTFKCKYGACIDEELACDGNPHCADWSDETPSVCKEFRASLVKSTRFRRQTNTWKESDCGKFDQNPVPLQGGLITRDNDEGSILPWHAIIYRLRNTSSDYLCAGTIISPSLIASAAHCVWDLSSNQAQDPSMYIITVGKYNLQRISPSEQTFKVKEIHVPPGFRGRLSNFANDISILKLDGSIKTSEIVHPICVDIQNVYSNLLTDGKLGLIGGWNGNVKSGSLKLHSMPFVEAVECESAIPNNFQVYLTFDKFCAGILNGTNTCVGDSGTGYATQFRDGKWYLTGILSIGVGSSGVCQTRFYNAFTRISLHTDFIKEASQASPASSNADPFGLPVEPTTTTQPSFPSTTPSDYHPPARPAKPPSPPLPPPAVSTTYPPPGGSCLNKFQCRSGHCIDRDNICDNIIHCPDGSDENPNYCGSKNTSYLSCSCSTKLGCTLPEHPKNGQYTIMGCKSILQAAPGNVIPSGVLLNYVCDSGFTLNGPQVVLCVDGWSSSITPVCKEVLCPPLSDNSRDIECILQGEDIDCKHPMPQGTKATVRCKTQYENVPALRTYSMTCKNDGTWNRELHSCVPRCGEPNPLGVAFIGNGQISKRSEYPWHIGLYKYQKNGSLILHCGGTLISSRVIVSAGHCFPDDTNKNMQNTINQYKIVAGKYFRDWSKTSKYTQHLEIEKIVLHSQYRGGNRNYVNDIAVIILKYEIRMDEAVRPVCIDFEKSYFKYFSPGIVGNVNGWGWTENQTESDVLRTADLPYVSQVECEENSPTTFHDFLIGDKFCAGKGKTVVCQGDSGGGYAVKFPHTKRYYLVGVVSIGPSEHCALYPYAAFTGIYHHLEFVQNLINTYF